MNTKICPCFNMVIAWALVAIVLELAVISHELSVLIVNSFKI